jgi:hypothetical protein
MGPTSPRQAGVVRRAAFAAALASTILAFDAATAAPPDDAPMARAGDAAPKPKTVGVVTNDPKAYQGYTLVFPLPSKKTYLIDMQGSVVRTWESKYLAGQEAYLLSNGNMLRSAKLADSEARFAGAGAGGRVQEFTWNGDLVWDYKYHNEKQVHHHAVTRLPNGNVLLIVWERKTAAQAIAAGVKPQLAGRGDMLVDCLIEVQPAGKVGGRVVWEWHIWDHLIQDHDPSKPNYGDVAALPERIDANFARQPENPFAAFFAPSPRKDGGKAKGKDDALEKLKGIGYIGAGGGTKFEGFIPDWTHVNAVSYNAKLDQIMLSPREFNEVWIIDHSTTTAEAAGRTGGRSGKGGDLLYRWGNPKAYRAGTEKDQRLFVQHDTHWIPAGLPGEGHMLVFNNGTRRPDGTYSSVDEVVLPIDEAGRYHREPGKPFGPDQMVWSYASPKKTDFYAVFMSGAQRLPNGNTLISTGFSGTIFEVTPDKEVVWKYVVPMDSDFKPGMFAFFGIKGGANPVFRAYRYGPDYPGLAGKDLTPGPPLEELVSKQPKK